MKRLSVFLILTLLVWTLTIIAHGYNNDGTYED